MRLKDLHELPKVRDSWSYLYVEHCRIDKQSEAIAIHDQIGLTPVPCASLTMLMLGPGTNITHAAVMTLADNGCLVIWCGEKGVRFYASGMGETRHANLLLKQAALCSHTPSRLTVVRRMYQLRFAEKLDESLSLQQIRGKEGVRVREAYARYSEVTGVPWTGRSYKRRSWNEADPINRALSCANSCLYGVCHAAIVSLGLSPGLGFIHTGKQLSFVYDIADLYKVDITVPAAFQVSAEAVGNLERRVRQHCRDRFHESRLLDRIVKDIQHILDVKPELETGADEISYDFDPAQPGPLWDPDRADGVEGGISYGENTESGEANS